MVRLHLLEEQIMKTPRLLHVGFAVLGLVGSLGCGSSGKVGDKLRPQDVTAKDALKEESVIKACKPAPGEPLVVDLRSSERSDFEVAMQDGVAVVSYNCKELKLLKSCSVKGATYVFNGVSRKEDVVQMQSKDEVEANIPISGAKLSADLKAGSTLELALITVGKKRTPLKKVHSADLDGDCDGATHVIRGAYVGAFAMGTGTSGQASAVAEMFGVGGGGSSASTRKATAKDGDLMACRKAEPSASAPPPECQAITRLDLIPIRLGENPARVPPPPQEEPTSGLGDEPVPPPPSDSSSLSASSSSSTRAGKPSSKKPTKKPAPKPGPKLSLESSAAAPHSSSASSATRVVDDEPDAPPSCPDGFAWTGVMCKKK